MQNPLNPEALTADTVSVGDQIVCRVLGVDGAKHFTVVSDAYVDVDGYRVIEVEHPDGHRTIELTSSVGLSGQRFDGQWTAEATLNGSRTG